MNCKNVLFCIILVLFTVTFAFSQDVKVMDKTFKITCPSGFITFSIVYPGVETGDKEVSKKINSYLEDKFFNGFENIFGEKINILKKEDLKKCDAMFKDDVNKNNMLNIDIKYKVKLNKNDMLSIYYDGLSVLKNAAHPTKLYNGFTFDVKTGKVCSFSDLFKSKTDYMTKINSIIKNELKSKYKMDSFEPKKSYDFYLAENKLVIINLFDNFACQSIEVEIGFDKIKDILK